MVIVVMFIQTLFSDSCGRKKLISCLVKYVFSCLQVSGREKAVLNLYRGFTKTLFIPYINDFVSPPSAVEQIQLAFFVCFWYT